MVQLQLPGLEKCNFQCLTNCPMEPLGKDCLWDDPEIGMFDLVEYPEFFFWQWEHKSLVRPEPKDPLKTRCPRCFSTKVTIGYPLIECKNCGWNEALIDFPISHYFHLALLEEYKKRVKGGSRAENRRDVCLCS